MEVDVGLISGKTVAEAMSVEVNVGLISAKTVSVQARLDESVATLKRRAQTALAVGKGRLLGSSAGLLDDALTVQEAKLETGSSLTLHLRKVEIQTASGYGRLSEFAAILTDGSVATWRSASGYGVHRDAVQDRLEVALGGVQLIQAIRASEVSWGSPSHGVQQIQASERAFAAILADRSVVTWGYVEYGGDSRAVQDQLQSVQQIQATEGAFAAILADGSVVTWGNVEYGGDSRGVQDQLKGVQQIQASDRAFAAILTDGSVVTWGDPDHGGNSCAVQDQLKGVQQIQASGGAFCSYPDRRIGCSLGR